MLKFSYLQSKNNGVDTDAFVVQFPTDRFDDVDKACKDVISWAIEHKEIHSINITNAAIHLCLTIEKDVCCAANYLYEAHVELTINVHTNEMKIESHDTSMNALSYILLFIKDPYETEKANDFNGDSDIIEKMKLIAKRGKAINY